MSSFFEALGRVFSGDGFVPRRFCGLWPEWLVWEHVAGNALVWLAYIAVPVMIWRLGVRRPEWTPFRGVVRAFALFIGLCGLGHFLDMVAFFHPMYRLSGHVLAATGLVSWWTAWSLRGAWPALMAMKSPAELERVIARRTEELTRAIAELKRAEEALRRSEEKFRGIVETANEGIWMLDEQGRIEFVNPRMAAMLGYEPAAMVGRPKWDFLFEEDRDTAIALFEQRRRGLSDQTDIRFRHQGGGIVWTIMAARPRLDSAGDFHGALDLFTGITDRVRAEEALRASERIYRAIGESIPFGVWVCDAEGRNTYASESFLQLVGLTPEQCSGFGWGDVLHPDDAERTIAAWKECVRTEGTWDLEHRFRGTAGRWHPVLARGVPVRADDGRIVAWAGINLDISRLKAAEAQVRRLNETLERRIAERTAELAAAEERFRGAFDAAAVGMALVAPDGRWLQVNASLCQIVGYSESELLEMTWKEITHPDDLDADLEQSRRLLAGEIPWYQMEKRYIHKDDRVIWIVLSGSLVRDESGQPLYCVAQLEDITARKQTEEELRRARDEAMAANRAKSEFLANMSHEIRTPMNGVIGMTELLLDTQLNDLQRGYAGTIRSCGEALLTVINDILDFSKIEAGKLTLESAEFDLRTLIEEVADLLAPRAHQKGLEITGQVAAEVPGRLVGDPVRIRQVLTNLAGNAVKFTERGQVDLAALLLSESDDGVTLRILVRDTGIGIRADRQADIFESFTQIEGGSSRRHGGTGLGLAICRRLVALMGGRIGLESELGQGSTFWFEVALGTGCGGPDIPVAEPGRAKRLSPLRILLAEDNEVNGRVAIGMVERLGGRVDAVRNGREVVEALDYSRHDLILMDVQMPEMDGFAATAVIRKRERGTGRHIPIIAMTAHAMQGDRERCLAAGMDGYLAKPIRPGPLRKALRTWGVQDGPTPEEAGRHREPEPRSFSATILGQSCGNDPELTCEVLELMLEGVPVRLERLEAALAARAGRQVAWEAHGLKGAFVTVGAEAMAAACQELITLGERGDFAAIATVDRRPLRDRWESLKEEARRYLETMPGLDSRTVRRSSVRRRCRG